MVLCSLFWIDVIPGFGFSVISGAPVVDNFRKFFVDFNATGTCLPLLPPV